MGQLIKDHDWAGTSLGALSTWSQSLRTAVSLMLHCKTPAAIGWGPRLLLIYNDAYVEALGELPAPTLGSPLGDVASGSHALMADQLLGAFRSGEGCSPRAVEIPVKRDGKLIITYWTITASPVRDENGTLVGTFNVGIETPQRNAYLKRRDARQAELIMEGARLAGDMANRTWERKQTTIGESVALQNAERVQLALAAGAIIGTWNWDLTKDAFTVDEAFANHFGFTDEMPRVELPLAQVVQNVHPDDRDSLSMAINEAINRGGPYAHQYRVRRQDGRYYWLEANGRVDHDNNGRPFRFPGVLIDVDARRALVQERDRAFDELRELNERLEQRVNERTTELIHAEEALRQSQKMEAIGQLTGGLAHDFNNLLAGITGALDLIALRLEQGRVEGLGKYVGAAQNASTRAAALTHRLLAFARRQTLLPVPTNVTRLVSDMLDLIQRTVGPSIYLRHLPTHEPWRTLVDQSQLENALLNLCINARDAMPQGGNIDIFSSNVSVDATLHTQLSVPLGEYLTISVVDSGTGMSSDVIKKAFDPFFTTKPMGEGTGLGLSMIYGFAKQSGGHVRIHSEVSCGTTVTIYLPRHLGAEEVTPQTPLNVSLSPADGGETIVFVDDEPSIRLLFKDVLEDIGYNVIEAADSVSGLQIIQSDIKIDLLVSDVGLPGGMNGRQLADAARVLRPNLRVLFITGFAEGSLLEDRHLAAGMAVLTKPFGVSALVARVKTMLEGNQLNY